MTDLFKIGDKLVLNEFGKSCWEQSKWQLGDNVGVMTDKSPNSRYITVEWWYEGKLINNCYPEEHLTMAPPINLEDLL